jgi:hypothetical protein
LIIPNITSLSLQLENLRGICYLWSFKGGHG